MVGSILFGLNRIEHRVKLEADTIQKNTQTQEISKDLLDLLN